MDSLDEPLMTIVGVAGNVKHASLAAEVEPEAYVSYLQRPLRTQNPMTIVVRPVDASMAAALVPMVRDQVRRADGDVPVEFSMVADRIGRSVADRRFLVLAVGLFAVIALLLAAVGIYGVLAYSVAQRTQEIGIRMALGADARSVVGLMLRGSMGAVVTGMAMGLVAAVFATRYPGVIPVRSPAIRSAGARGGVAALAAVAWLAGNSCPPRDSRRSTHRAAGPLGRSGPTSSWQPERQVCPSKKVTAWSLPFRRPSSRCSSRSCGYWTVTLSPTFGVPFVDASLLNSHVSVALF